MASGTSTTTTSMPDAPQKQTKRMRRTTSRSVNLPRSITSDSNVMPCSDHRHHNANVDSIMTYKRRKPCPPGPRKANARRETKYRQQRRKERIITEKRKINKTHGFEVFRMRFPLLTICQHRAFYQICLRTNSY